MFEEGLANMLPSSENSMDHPLSATRAHSCKHSSDTVMPSTNEEPAHPATAKTPCYFVVSRQGFVGEAG